MSKVIDLFTRKPVEDATISSIHAHIAKANQGLKRLNALQDRIAKLKTLDTGYWGHEIRVVFAWLPTKTLEGWIWGRLYMRFRTNDGFHKEGWAWIVKARTTNYAKMQEIRDAFLKEKADERAKNTRN
jgi:hypothetical protein